MAFAGNGEFDKADALYSKYDRFVDLLFSEVNPIPIKYACAQLGLCKNILRLPLTPMSEAKAQILREEMQRLQII